MARPRKPPAFLVEAVVAKSAKLASLPGDSARLGFFYVVLAEAKVSEPVPGQFASRAHFKAVAGRFSRFLDDYLATGILELAPRLCQRCRGRWSAMPPKTGVLVVHDWHEHQYDPRKIERQREYEDRQRDAEASVSDAVSDAQSDAVSDAIPTVISHAPVTPARRDRAVNVERRTLNEESNQSLDRESEHRATDEQKNGSDGPRLTKAQLDAWRSFGSEWDDVKAAWLARGFRHPPAGDPDDERSQRALLYEILDARPTDLVRWIRDAPAKAPSDQVVGHVLGRWKAVKAEVEADEPVPWLQERRGPMEPVGSVVERVVGR